MGPLYAARAVLSRTKLWSIISGIFSKNWLIFSYMQQYTLKLFFKRLQVIILLSIAGASNIFSWIWLLWHIRPTEDPLFLHYSVLFGVDLTGPWHSVFVLPAIGLAIILLNTYFAAELFQKDRFASYVLLFGAALCQLFVLIISLLLVFLNV